MTTATVPATTGNAQRIAEDFATQYFDALTAEIPFDTAPGGVNLVEAVRHIETALMIETAARRTGWEAEFAMRAAYLLGIAIGRRLGGAR